MVAGGSLQHGVFFFLLIRRHARLTTKQIGGMGGVSLRHAALFFVATAACRRPFVVANAVWPRPVVVANAACRPCSGRNECGVQESYCGGERSVQALSCRSDCDVQS